MATQKVYSLVIQDCNQDVYFSYAQGSLKQVTSVWSVPLQAVVVVLKLSRRTLLYVTLTYYLVLMSTGPSYIALHLETCVHLISTEHCACVLILYHKAPAL
jgi:hypothetical protein